MDEHSQGPTPSVQGASKQAHRRDDDQAASRYIAETLLDLPPELLDRIIEDCSQHDRFRLATASRAMCALVRPVLYRRPDLALGFCRSSSGRPHLIATFLDRYETDPSLFTLTRELSLSLYGACSSCASHWTRRFPKLAAQFVVLRHVTLVPDDLPVQPEVWEVVQSFSGLPRVRAFCLLNGSAPFGTSEPFSMPSVTHLTCASRTMDEGKLSAFCDAFPATEQFLLLVDGAASDPPTYGESLVKLLHLRSLTMSSDLWQDDIVRQVAAGLPSLEAVFMVCVSCRDPTKFRDTLRINPAFQTTIPRLHVISLDRPPDEFVEATAIALESNKFPSLLALAIPRSPSGEEGTPVQRLRLAAKKAGFAPASRGVDLTFIRIGCDVSMLKR